MQQPAPTHLLDRRSVLSSKVVGNVPSPQRYRPDLPTAEPRRGFVGTILSLRIYMGLHGGSAICSALREAERLTNALSALPWPVLGSSGSAEKKHVGTGDETRNVGILPLRGTVIVVFWASGRCSIAGCAATPCYFAETTCRPTTAAFPRTSGGDGELCAARMGRCALQRYRRLTITIDHTHVERLRRR